MSHWREHRGGDFLQVKSMNHLMAVVGIIVRFESERLGQVAHGGIAGRVH